MSVPEKPAPLGLPSDSDLRGKIAQEQEDFVKEKSGNGKKWQEVNADDQLIVSDLHRKRNQQAAEKVARADKAVAQAREFLGDDLKRMPDQPSDDFGEIAAFKQGEDYRKGLSAVTSGLKPSGVVDDPTFMASRRTQFDDAPLDISTPSTPQFALKEEEAPAERIKSGDIIEADLSGTLPREQEEYIEGYKTVRLGDGEPKTLSLIAQKYYQDLSAWKAIATLNNIPEGTETKLPKGKELKLPGVITLANGKIKTRLDVFEG